MKWGIKSCSWNSSTPMVFPWSCSQKIVDVYAKLTSMISGYQNLHLLKQYHSLYATDTHCDSGTDPRQKKRLECEWARWTFEGIAFHHAKETCLLCYWYLVVSQARLEMDYPRQKGIAYFFKLKMAAKPMERITERCQGLLRHFIKAL